MAGHFATKVARLTVKKLGSDPCQYFPKLMDALREALSGDSNNYAESFPTLANCSRNVKDCFVIQLSAATAAQKKSHLGWMNVQIERSHVAEQKDFRNMISLIAEAIVGKLEGTSVDVDEMYGALYSSITRRALTSFFDDGERTEAEKQGLADEYIELINIASLSTRVTGFQVRRYATISGVPHIPVVLFTQPLHFTPLLKLLEIRIKYMFEMPKDLPRCIVKAGVFSKQHGNFAVMYCYYQQAEDKAAILDRITEALKNVTMPKVDDLWVKQAKVVNESKHGAHPGSVVLQFGDMKKLAKRLHINIQLNHISCVLQKYAPDLKLDVIVLDSLHVHVVYHPVDISALTEKELSTLAKKRFQVSHLSITSLPVTLFDQLAHIQAKTASVSTSRRSTSPAKRSSPTQRGPLTTLPDLA